MERILQEGTRPRLRDNKTMKENTEKQMERIADELAKLNITLKSIDETLAAPWFASGE